MKLRLCLTIVVVKRWIEVVRRLLVAVEIIRLMMIGRGGQCGRQIRCVRCYRLVVRGIKRRSTTATRRRVNQSGCGLMMMMVIG